MVHEKKTVILGQKNIWGTKKTLRGPERCVRGSHGGGGGKFLGNSLGGRGRIPTKKKT